MLRVGSKKKLVARDLQVRFEQFFGRLKHKWAAIRRGAAIKFPRNRHGLCSRGRLRTLKEKNGVILTQKVESLAELKFDQGFRVIGTYLFFCLSQIDSMSRVKLTQCRESNWLNVESQIDSMSSRESNWLNVESQIDSMSRVKLTI